MRNHPRATTRTRRRCACAEALEDRRLLAQIYSHYGPGFSDGGLNGVVAFATPDDGAGSDQGITITLSNVPAHAIVDVSAMIGFDPDGWTATVKVNGETAGEASEGPAGYGSQHTATLGGTVASSGPAGGTVTIDVSIDGFEGYGWGLNWLQASVSTPPLPNVTISGGGTTLQDTGAPVSMTVSRDGDSRTWNEPLDVNLTYDDDVTGPSTVTIPAYAGVSAPFAVTPVDDGDEETGTEDVHVTIQPSNRYAGGGIATITLAAPAAAANPVEILVAGGRRGSGEVLVSSIMAEQARRFKIKSVVAGPAGQIVIDSQQPLAQGGKTLIDYKYTGPNIPLGTTVTIVLKLVAEDDEDITTNVVITVKP